MISYDTTNTTNYINGIPNLSLIPGNTYSIKLNYKLTEYSKYYGLDNTVNFVDHLLKSAVGSDVNISSIEPRNWDSKDKCTRTTTGWTIKDLVIKHDSSTNKGTLGARSPTDGSDADVRLHLYLKNTYGDAVVEIDSTYSTLYRFIYDKNSVDYYNSIKSILKQAQQITTTDTAAPTAYTAVGTNTNEHQLNMWNGYFYSKAGWIASTGITSSNCSTYAIGTNDVMFKGKADCISQDMIIDLKTTSDINKFANNASYYYYDSQAYIYQQLFTMPMVFFVIGKQKKQYGTTNEDYYDVGVFNVSPEFIAQGKDKVQHAMLHYEKYFSPKAEAKIEDIVLQSTL